jgi:molybdate transport system substrate-binding protein
MKMSFSVRASLMMLGLALALGSTSARAAELQVLAGGGMTAPLKDIGVLFEKSSGHRLIFHFGTTPELIKLATGDRPFDLAVVPREVFQDASAQAQFVPGPTIGIARVGLGVAVRSGEPKPDISTPEALKQALLKAKSIATIPQSAAGAQVLRVFERLGIGDAIKAKMKAEPGTAQIIQTVAAGEAELGVFLVNVLTAPGLDVVGPIPAELQQEIVFTAAVAVHTKEAEAAKAFIDYLKNPPAVAVIVAKGMKPE